MKIEPTLQRFIDDNQDADIREIALQAHKYPTLDIAYAIQQIYGRRIAKDKIPTWYAHKDILYPQQLSMEQCSSEDTASFKATLAKGNTMIDLTGGFGVDFSFLAHKFEKAIYVEENKELAAVARQNLKVLKLDWAQVIAGNSIDYLAHARPVDFIYIDPARRDTIGNKTIRIEDCTPNIKEIESLLEEKSEQTMIKLSPMLDITLALNTLRNISDVYTIAVNNEVKELLLIKKKTSAPPTLHCINIKKEAIQQFSFTQEGEKNIHLQCTNELGKYLYEPNSAILKTGAYKSIAVYYQLNKLHASSHLYTSDILHADFQGRKFEIEHVCTLNKKDLKHHLSTITQGNITTRNFPLSVAELRKKLKLKEGGDTYIFATTLCNEQKVLIIGKRL